MWHIRPEFEHFLSEENSYDGPGSTTSATVHKGGRPAGKEKEKESKTSQGQTKRKREDDDEEEDEDDAQKGSVKGASGGSKKEPKKFKRAFGFFVKAKRADAESKIGDPTVIILLLLNIITIFNP